jgi:hypothetical protein
VDVSRRASWEERGIDLLANQILRISSLPPHFLGDHLSRDHFLDNHFLDNHSRPEDYHKTPLPPLVFPL